MRFITDESPRKVINLPKINTQVIKSLLFPLFVVKKVRSLHLNLITEREREIEKWFCAPRE
jgi:hypothetical protein